VWKLSLDDVPGDPTLNERQLAADAAERQAMLDTPLVRAALAAFPDAELEWPNQRSTA